MITAVTSINLVKVDTTTIWALAQNQWFKFENKVFWWMFASRVWQQPGDDNDDDNNDDDKDEDDDDDDALGLLWDLKSHKVAQSCLKSPYVA